MKSITTFICLALSTWATAQSRSLTGIVTNNGSPVPFAYVELDALQKAAVADEQGHFSLENLPSGRFLLTISCMGFLTDTLEADLNRGDLRLGIILQEAPFDINAVVVSGTRTARRRLQNPIAVNVLDEAAFQATQSNTLSEGLCFQPGLRMEVDCQTCNYSQLRMNGLGGAYSQVLVNNRPIFTSLMSLYSLEQMPASQVDRVEVVRGGGSVLYGANAIAGTVNIITKTPEENTWSVTANQASVAGEAADAVFNANSAVVAEGGKGGISFFASHRQRQPFDANGDGFSEMPLIRNNSLGFKAFFKPGESHRLELTAWGIQEFRRGGNAFDLPADRADQAEERDQQVLIGGVDYAFQPSHGRYSWSAYFAAQSTGRRHYTGIDHSDGWGNTSSGTFTGGLQWNRYLALWGRKNTLTLGAEHLLDDTFDEIPAYHYLIDQTSNLSAVFFQTDWDLLPTVTLLAGIRFNKHNFVKKMVATPRLSLLWKPYPQLQFRASWAQGFKAPQAFETDMHIAFAGGGVSVISLVPGLRPETSNSFNGSVDFNRPAAKYIFGFTLDAFRTRLFDAFVLEEAGANAEGGTRLLRKNGSAATVAGITVEGRFNYDQQVQLELGATFQASRYDDAVAWSAELAGTRSFLRSPNRYGYFILRVRPEKPLGGSISGVYTGPMGVPHFAGAPNVQRDTLLSSPNFMEINLKLDYKLHLHAVETDLEFFVGLQNLLDAYQSDFDTGKYRDSNYVYGPARPRTWFVGLRFGRF